MFTREQQQNHENQINNEFQLDDIDQDPDAREAHLRQKECQLIYPFLIGKVHLHDARGIAAKLMDGWSEKCGVHGYEHDSAGVEVSEHLYYRDFQVNYRMEGWVFEDVEKDRDGKIFSDPSLMQGLKTIDVMMKNEGVS